MTESAEYQPDGAMPPLRAHQLKHLGALAAAMRERLDACRQKPDDPEVEAVHQLRTGTRRVEAMLEMLAREAGARGLGKPVEEARQRWLRQLKRVRRAAGAVRDLDVHREIIEENFLEGKSDPSEAAAQKVAVATGADEPAVLTGQVHAIDAWLKDRRAAAAAALGKTLAGHADRLLEAEQGFMAAVQQGRFSRARRPAARLGLEDYLRLVDAMPHLDKENLHDFRKGVKKARYVAESEENDPAAKAMAKAIKRVQDAIGEWHDWDVLAAEAREALGHDGDALRSQLAARAQNAYERAMRMTTATNRRLVGEWRASHPQRRAVRKRAPSRG